MSTDYVPVIKGQSPSGSLDLGAIHIGVDHNRRKVPKFANREEEARESLLQLGNTWLQYEALFGNRQLTQWPNSRRLSRKHRCGKRDWTIVLYSTAADVLLGNAKRFKRPVEGGRRNSEGAA